MKSFSTIEYYGDHWGLPIYAFDKPDGSNLRFEWSKKRGFYKFGSRNVLIDESHDPFGFAVKLFRDKYEEGLNRVFRTKEYRDVQSFVCFAELVGTKSAFGQHQFGNDDFDIVLFDVDQYKRGLVPPGEFLKNFGELGVPRVVYTGNLNKELVLRVKANEFGLTEGVICKGKVKTRKGVEQLYYCKIKTDDWFTRLRALGDEKLLREELLQASKAHF